VVHDVVTGRAGGDAIGAADGIPDGEKNRHQTGTDSCGLARYGRSGWRVDRSSSPPWVGQWK
jgi:hypothetical protein